MLGKLKNNNGGYLVFKGKKYAINLSKLKEVCLFSNGEIGQREFEISQAYEANENGDLSMSSKIEHETKISGNPQNDMIVYDIVKMMILSLLENTATEDAFKNDFATCLSVNTLVSWGVLEVLE